MTRSSTLSLIAGLACLLPGAMPAAAQGAGTFLITVTESGVSRLVPSGQTVQFRSVLGRTSQITIDVSYNGSFRGELGLANLVGSTDFRFAAAAAMPAILQPGNRVTFLIDFTPSARSSLSQLAITARELPPEGSNLLPGNFGLVSVGLAGAVPDVKFAYALQADSNVVPVAGGGTVAFQPTTINTPAMASFFIFNQGLAFAEVESVRLTGDSEFQIFELPLMPSSLGAGSSSRFLIRYFPRAAGNHAATLTVAADGITTTLAVTGSARGPAWVYELIPTAGDQPPTRFEPDTTVALPDTELTRRATVWVRVTNAGNFDGEISGISILGQGFGLVDPPFAPMLLKPERSVTFGILFVPQQAGRNMGRLRIGSDFFNLTATAVGAQLEYSFSAASASMPVNAGGVVVLPSTAVGQTTMALFTLQNSGNRAATIPSISLSGAGAAFSLEGLPALPLVLEPDQRVTFRIVFRPTQPGPNSDVLAAGLAFFNLSGAAAALPPLPAYSFTGPSGTVQPLQQPGIGLTLSQPYPVALRGSLTIGVDSTTFSSDPAVQFATGGRVVGFTIPANTTRAVFPNNANTIRLQTGTVAGTIIISPLFVTDAGISRTPDNPAVLTMTVPELAPQLTDLRMDLASDGVVFVITGHTTPRNLTKIDLTIVRDGADDATFSFDVAASSNLWFSSSGSQGAGGLFSASIPFRITGSAEDIRRRIDQIRSATAVVTNRTGASQPITVTFR